MLVFEPTIKGKIFVLVDFDGTITTERDDMHGECFLRPNVREVLYRLYDTGKVKFGLWTCRHDGQLRKAETFLMEKGIYHVFEHINGDFKEVVEFYGDTETCPRKSSADVYFDDRGLLGREVDWLEFENYILQCIKDMEGTENVEV